MVTTTTDPGVGFRLLPEAALAQKLGPAALIDARARLAEHGGKSGTKALSAVGAMHAGGDSIDDVALRRPGEGASVPGRRPTVLR